MQFEQETGKLWKLSSYSIRLIVVLFRTHVKLQMLHETVPEIYEEFKQGNWVVNNHSCVPFRAAGADNALEHVNQSFKKVSGGLVELR